MTTAPTLRERNRIRARTDILDAAAEWLGEAEGTDFTLEMLGQRAGLSRGTLYSHFPGGREEILGAAYLREAEFVRDRGIALREAATDIPARITALATAFIDSVATPTGRFYGRLGSGDETTLSPLLVGVLGGTSRFFEDLVRADLEEARGAGALSADVDPSAAAVVLSGAMRAAGRAAAQDPEAGPALVHAIAALVASLVPNTSAGS